MTQASERHDDDDDRMVAYARGELDEAERVAFEARLASEPRLAAEYERFVELDLVGELLAARGPAAQPVDAPQPVGRRLLRYGALAAALAAAVAVVLLWPTKVALLTCTVRAAATASADDLAAYARAVGTRDPDRLPRDTPRGTPRVGGPAQTTTAADFLARLAEGEAARDRRLLATASGVVTADFVTIRFVADADCSAVVLMLDSRGRLGRRYPSPPGATIFGEVANAFADGSVHVLPRPIAVARDPYAVSMHPGFDVPSDLAVGVVWFVTALRRQPVDGALLAELDAHLADWRGAQVGAVAADPAQRDAAAERDLGPAVAWLSARGFVVTISTVVRP